MDYKQVLGAISIIIAFVGYVPYFRDISVGKTKPHAFSWLVWGLLTGIGFFGQMVDKAGPGAWVTGFTALICLIIFLVALTQGERNIVLIDWLCLIGASIAIIFWYFTKGPLLSVILITLIDTLGFIPTFRKSVIRPFEETISTYVLSGLKFVIALLALEKVSIITTLYPLSLVLLNWFFVVVLFIRRKQLKV